MSDPSDGGATFGIDLGIIQAHLDGLPLLVGSAPTETQALADLTTVDAADYALSQPATGRANGGPATVIVGVDP